MRHLWIAAALTMLAACSTPPPSAAIPFPFQALGNEPGWSVLIDENQDAIVELYYGEQQYQLQLPKPQITFAGTHYRTEFNSALFSLDIIATSCSDTMSDTSYPYETILQINGEKFTGCGRQRP